MKGESGKYRCPTFFATLGRDSRGRTLAKTIVYRVVAIALLAAITYYLTGDAGEATTITILFNVGGTVSYYGLERLWEYIDWGRSASETKLSGIDGRAMGTRRSLDNSEGLASVTETSLIVDVEAN